MEEALHAASIKAMQAGIIHGIVLPSGMGQQLLIQYADDTNYTLQSSRENMNAIMSLLQLFAQAMSLTTN
jgi:hypothetical protein